MTAMTCAAAGGAGASAAILPPHPEITDDVAKCIVKTYSNDCSTDECRHIAPSFWENLRFGVYAKPSSLPI